MAELYLRNANFLVVDDNPFSCEFFRKVLYALGARNITIAKDGNAAFKLVKELNPDVAIVDWEMKPVNGLEFTRWIRTSKDTPNRFLPIIMVSSHATPRHVTTARDSGINEYLIMPISAKALFSRIEAVIERPRAYIRLGEFFGPDRRRRTKGFEGDERRTVAAAKAKKVAAAEQVMRQEEVDAFFNPDDEAEPKTDAGGKVGQSPKS